MPPDPAVGSGDFDEFADLARSELGGAHTAREAALPLCRQAIRAAGLAIRAVHRGMSDDIDAHTATARACVSQAREVLGPYPDVASAGFLHDAEKEYAEACVTAALVAGSRPPRHDELNVRLAAWLNGMAEAASELRRTMLDSLRRGKLADAERVFGVMESAYEMLRTVDYPDAITGGLRRSVDALRAVVERSRSDLTVTVTQERLRAALADSGGAADMPIR